MICTHNRPAVLERCLRAVQKLDYPKFAIVVVDSVPNSSEAQALAARYDAEYCASPVKGLSRARNIGTRATQSDIVAYLDDDMVPHVDWLRSLVDEFFDKNVGAVTGPVLPLERRASTMRNCKCSLKEYLGGHSGFRSIEQARSGSSELTSAGSETEILLFAATCLSGSEVLTNASAVAWQ